MFSLYTYTLCLYGSFKSRSSFACDLNTILASLEINHLLDAHFVFILDKRGGQIDIIYFNQDCGE